MELMEKKYYAIAGQWRPGQVGALGIKCYRYDPDTGCLDLIETVRGDITAGQLCVDTKRNMVYVVDEIGHIRGDLGGGAYVYAFRMDTETGKLTLVSEKRSLAAYPCYLCLDPTGKYLLVSHNSDREHVTKITQREDGSFTSEIVYDDAALVMFRVNDDGSLDDICDLSITPSGGMGNPRAKVMARDGKIAATVGVMSHLHSVSRNADGTLFAVCDMGMGIIYTYHIDRAGGKLVPVNRYDEDVERQVRYSAFHPTQSYLYVNCEKSPYILGYKYRAEDGALENICKVRAVPGDTKVEAGGNDLLIHPNGKYLYCSNISNTISLMEIAGDGMLTLKQSIDCGGNRPRALCLSPDHRFLFCGNNRSGTITSFSVAADGTLTPTGMTVDDVMPSALAIFSC